MEEYSVKEYSAKKLKVISEIRRDLVERITG
jgi:hypothetical protein